MKSLLPPTGTAALLRELSPYVPEAFVNQRLPRPAGCGRPRRFSPAQLDRIHLLALLPPAPSFNLLGQMLPEQRDWRRFAHRPTPRTIPDVWMRHELRDRRGVAGLRHIHEQLVAPPLPVASPDSWSVALMDATDLPAAAAGHKKRGPAATPPGGPRSGRARSRPGRAVSSWGTRSTPSVCGSHAPRGACGWGRWSVGSLLPT